MTNRAALIAELEAANKGSSEIDAKIEFFVNGKGRVVVDEHGNANAIPTTPYYTGSLDAALTLVPEGYWWGAEIWAGSVGRKSLGRAYVYTVGIDGRLVRFRGFAETPALAVCIAALKAHGG